MAVVTKVIKCLGARGISLRLEGTDGLRVIGISKLTDQERAVLKAHKVALLQSLRQSAEPVNDRQSETLSWAPRFNEHPGAVATGVKYGLYAPNCNRCRRYRWRSETCQQQGLVEFANTPPCQGRYYQAFAPTLAEREAMAGVTGEDVP